MFLYGHWGKFLDTGLTQVIYYLNLSPRSPHVDNNNKVPCARCVSKVRRAISGRGAAWEEEEEEGEIINLDPTFLEYMYDGLIGGCVRNNVPLTNT